jgi:hypothetical protein
MPAPDASGGADASGAPSGAPDEIDPRLTRVDARIHELEADLDRAVVIRRAVSMSIILLGGAVQLLDLANNIHEFISNQWLLTVISLGIAALDLLFEGFTRWRKGLQRGPSQTYAATRATLAYLYAQQGALEAAFECQGAASDSGRRFLCSLEGQIEKAEGSL